MTNPALCGASAMAPWMTTRFKENEEWVAIVAFGLEIFWLIRAASGRAFERVDARGICMPMKGRWEAPTVLCVRYSPIKRSLT
eukprot:8273921-Pyramimonas_sp.AAC.1